MPDKMKTIEHNEEVFEVVRRKVVPGYVILAVKFPNCPHSRKIMVYREENAPTEDASKINPHFGRPDSPVARFEPDAGWGMAVAFCISESFNPKRQDDVWGERDT